MAMGRLGKQHRLEPVVDLNPDAATCVGCFFYVEGDFEGCLEVGNRFDCCPDDIDGRTFIFVLREVVNE